MTARSSVMTTTVGTGNAAALGRRRWGRRPFVTAIAVAVVAAGLQAVSAAPPANAAPSAVADVNPDSLTSGSLFGGRTVAFSTNPVNTQVVFAATEFGGLFRSSNHGSSWS